MSRRRIWLMIIGILIAGVSATWAMERFVSSHGVNTAAVVGFEAENSEMEVRALAMAENEMAMKDMGPGAETESTQADVSSEETVKSPLETDRAVPENAAEAKLAIKYTCSDLKDRLEAARIEAEKYQDDPAMSQTSRYAAAEYVRNLWDRELNLIYSSIHKEMDESTAEALRREEVEWIKKRDLAADRASTKSSGTPAQSIEYVRTSASVTMERCYELLENYGDFLDQGDAG